MAGTVSGRYESAVSDCWVCHNGKLVLVLGHGFIGVRCLECEYSITIDNVHVDR